MDFHTLLCFKLFKSSEFFSTHAYSNLNLNSSGLSKDGYFHDHPNLLLC